MIFYSLMFLFMTILYLNILVRKKSIINIYFFLYVNVGLIMICPNILSMYFRGEYFHLRNGDFYLLFYIFFLSFGIYLIEKYSKGVKCFTMKDNTSKKPIYLLFILLIGLYWLKNISILKLAISNPRMFYASTRLGGGIIYYIVVPISIFLYFCYIASLNYHKHTYNKIAKAVIATALIMSLVYIFGQKATLLTIIFIFLSTLNFKLPKRNKNRVLITFGILSCVAFLGIFALYTRQQNMRFINIFRNVASYSDYIANFNDLVDNLDSFYYGQIIFENETLCYIPRALWPNKPELFGSLKLGLNVPRLVDWTLSLTGAPSFGPIGPAYADFGFVGVIFYTLYQLLLAYIAKGFERSLSRYNFWYHFAFLTFSGVLIFNVTLPIIPIYQIAVIIVLHKFVSKNHKRRKKECTYEITN